MHLPIFWSLGMAAGEVWPRLRRVLDFPKMGWGRVAACDLPTWRVPRSCPRQGLDVEVRGNPTLAGKTGTRLGWGTPGSWLGKLAKSNRQILRLRSG